MTYITIVVNVFSISTSSDGSIRRNTLVDWVDGPECIDIYFETS